MQVNAKKHRSYMRGILKDQGAHLNLDVVRQPYITQRKYLMYVLHEHLSETKHVEVLTAAASRSFGRIHSIFK